MLVVKKIVSTSFSKEIYSGWINHESTLTYFCPLQLSNFSLVRYFVPRKWRRPWFHPTSYVTYVTIDDNCTVYSIIVKYRLLCSSSSVYLKVPTCLSCALPAPWRGADCQNEDFRLDWDEARCKTSMRWRLTPEEAWLDSLRFMEASSY